MTDLYLLAGSIMLALLALIATIHHLTPTMHTDKTTTTTTEAENPWNYTIERERQQKAVADARPQFRTVKGFIRHYARGAGRRRGDAHTILAERMRGSRRFWAIANRGGDFGGLLEHMSNEARSLAARRRAVTEVTIGRRVYDRDACGTLRRIA